MNVLFLSELLYPHGGGAELATYLYADLLSKANFNVRVITHRFDGETASWKRAGIEILRLQLLGRTSMKYSMLSNFPVLFSSVLRESIRWADIVYIPLYWYSAIPLAKAQGKPVIIHLHNYILSCPMGTLFEVDQGSVCGGRSVACRAGCILAHERESSRDPAGVLASVGLNSMGKNVMGWLASLCDAIVCVSKAQYRLTAETISKNLANKLCVAYNPVPNVQFVESEGVDFGYFGGYSNSKGLPILYKALRLFNQHHKSGVHILATKFGNLSKTLRVRLERAGFVLYGRLDEQDYEGLFKQIRCVVVPSVWAEPLPYVVIEALLKGRLVLASKAGGIPEILEGCDGARLVEPGNHRRLADELEFMSSLEHGDALELGIRNRNAILKRFDNERILQKFISILDAVS